MKASFVAATAAFAGLASAGSAHRRAHDQFKAVERDATPAEECGCSTVYTTWYGEPTRKLNLLSPSLF